MNVEETARRAPDERDSRGHWVILGLLFVAGLGLRLWGLGSGFPHEYNVAERGYVVAPWRFEWGAPVAMFFSFHSVVLLVEFEVLKLLSPLFDWLSLPDYFVLSDDPPRSTFTVLGRLTSAVVGAAMVFPVYGLARWAWDRRAGLVAAAFIALTFAPIREAHFGSPDVLAIFLAVTSVWFSARSVETGRWRDYLWAGVLAGLALSAKLLHGPAFLAIWLFHAFGRSWPQRGVWPWIRDRVLHPRPMGAAVAGLGAYLLATPQIATNLDGYLAFWRAVASLGRLGGVDRYAISHDPAPLFYLDALRWGTGELLTLLIFAAVVAALVQRSRRALLVLSFPLALYLLLLMPGRVYMSRYALPALPFLLVAAAGLLVWLVDRLPLPRRWSVPATALLAAVVLVQPVRSAVLHDRVLTRTDTRTAAKHWIESNVPEGASIVSEWHNPPIIAAAYEIEFTGPYGLRDRTKRSGLPPDPRPVDEFIDAGVEYLITTSYTSDHPMLDPAEEGEKEEFYASLDRRAELVAEFSPFAGSRQPEFDFDQVYGPTIELSLLERPGPTVKVYRLPVTPATASSNGAETSDGTSGEIETETETESEAGSDATPPAGDAPAAR